MPYQIEIDPSNVYGKISNLANITRFNFRKVIPLPYIDRWFQPYPSSRTIVIGKVHSTYNQSIFEAYENSRKNLAKCQNFIEKKQPIIKYKKKNEIIHHIQIKMSQPNQLALFCLQLTCVH